MKSVCCSGTYFSLVWVPLRNPLLGESARSYGNLALIHVVACTEAVLFKSECHLYALLVMWLKHGGECIVDRVEEYHSGHDGSYSHKEWFAVAAQA